MFSSSEKFASVFRSLIFFVILLWFLNCTKQKLCFCSRLGIDCAASARLANISCARR